MQQIEQPNLSFDVIGFLTQRRQRRTTTKFKTNQIVFSQGDPADSIFYVHKGKVKVAVISARGKEGVVAIRGPDEFIGEDCLTDLPLRLATVSAMSPCEIIRLDKERMVRLLNYEPEFADYFLHHLLTRTARMEADLVYHLFSSAELRLARTLLLLTNYGSDLGPEPVAIKVTQQTLAGLVGTTRSRVNTFMNKFRKLGLIDYNGSLKVRKAMLNFVLNQKE